MPLTNDIGSAWARRSAQAISLEQMQAYRDYQETFSQIRSPLYRFYNDCENVYEWKATSDADLDEWELPDGEVRKMTNLTKKDLKAALGLLHRKKPCSGQESKVISMEKEWTSRGYR